LRVFFQQAESFCDKDTKPVLRAWMEEMSVEFPDAHYENYVNG
jgi:hypothetical protein